MRSISVDDFVNRLDQSLRSDIVATSESIYNEQKKNNERIPYFLRTARTNLFAVDEQNAFVSEGDVHLTRGREFVDDPRTKFDVFDAIAQLVIDRFDAVWTNRASICRNEGSDGFRFG